MAGYIDSANRAEYKFNKVTFKYQGEYIEKYLHFLYFNTPLVVVGFAFLSFLFYAVGFNAVGFFFFWGAVFSALLGGWFLYAMIHERLDKAVIGEVNKARKNQLSAAASEAIYYYANFGTAVYDFLGADPVDSVKRNLVSSNKEYDLLIDKKIYTMGLWVPGSTGSGKTVTLNSVVFIPALQTGSGFWYIEGKGDASITEGIMALVYQYGRELDTYVLNFGAAASGLFTHGINPLRIGNALVTSELMKNLVNAMEGDNSWVTDMAFGFMQALLVPLVLLRDLGMLVEKRDVNSINTFEDLKSKKHVYFNITQLNNYLGYQEMIDVLYMMRRLFKDPAFVKAVREITQYSRLKELEYAINSEMEQFLDRQNVPGINGVVKPDYNAVDDKTKQHNTHAIQPWSSTLVVFGSERVFGNIFNKEYDDFSPLAAIQTSKNIITVIPSMGYSADFCSKIGQMMTAVSKAAIGEMLARSDMEGEIADKARAKKYRPKKVPYAFVYDEPNSYGSEMIAQMSSMVRSVGEDGGGMAIVWSGQSYADIKKMDGGTDLAGAQLTANLGLIAVLNTDDKELQTFLSEKAGTKHVFMEEQSDVVKGSRGDNDVRNYRREELKEFPPEFFSKRLKPQTGETLVMQKGFLNPTRVISNFTPPCEADNIKFNRGVSYQVLFETFKTNEEIDKAIENLHFDYEKALEAEQKKIERMGETYEEEVLAILQEIAQEAYPDVEENTQFLLVLSSEKNKKVHGTYTWGTATIMLYDAVNNPREHFVGVGIHELAHHIEYKMYNNTGHSKRFYAIMHKLFGKAMHLGYIDYAKARELNQVDASDIKKMEDYFKAPIPW